MKYYIISGEASGDLHASNLATQLKITDEQAEIRAWGGEKLQAAGAVLAKNYKETSFMGFTQVIANLGKLKKFFAFCKQDILNFKPDIVILVDYPGFNLRIAKFTHQHKIRTYYYISPKIWAWKKKRAYKIKRLIDKMFVIFPFEIDFYKQYDYKVKYIGNPLLDEIENQKPLLSERSDFLIKNGIDDKSIIALLAGSRKQEIKRLLPKMIELSYKFPESEFVVAGAPGISKNFYSRYIKNSPVKLIFNQTYDLLHHAKSAVVTSGTATLETALFNVPQVVVYAGNFISFAIAKMVVHIEHISLVNIILQKEAVRELIQYDFNIQNLKEELIKITNSSKREKIMENYSKLQQILGGKGASEKAAKIIIEDLKSTKKQ